jgi:hypothetical protein
LSSKSTGSLSGLEFCLYVLNLQKFSCFGFNTKLKKQTALVMWIFVLGLVLFYTKEAK